MKYKLIALLGGCYLFFLLANLPANVALRFLPTPPSVVISSVSGTLWQGKAALVSVDNRYRFQKVSWEFNGLALLTFKLQFDVAFNNGAKAMSGKGLIAQTFSGLQVNDFMLDLPAQELLSYVQLPVPVSAKGDVAVVIEQASQGTPYCAELNARIVWQDALLTTQVGAVNLGNTDIQLSCVDGELVAELLQQSEQLNSSANVLLKEGGLYQLNGLITAKNQLDPAIKQAISWIGPKDKSGATILKFNGKL